MHCAAPEVITKVDKAFRPEIATDKGPGRFGLRVDPPKCVRVSALIKVFLAPIRHLVGRVSWPALRALPLVIGICMASVKAARGLCHRTARGRGAKNSCSTGKTKPY
jgi:hypothetical protein